ncbi:MAG: O-succinylhomoserine sulfhydrylase [Candidatus Aquiluna sp. XM-24bin5]|nr:MAG: O-succinylhomoserine sulfhydrylase [Candidatus Aquiluna sp. XM-24bin5]
MTSREKPWGYTGGEAKPSKREFRPETLAVRGALTRTSFQETSEALFLNSGFTYDSAEAAAASFAEQQEHHVYSRFSNPTVKMLEDRLAIMEGGEAAIGFASGMAAMFSAVASALTAGDRVVSSPGMFSSCYVVLNEILPRWGIEVVVTPDNSEEAWRSALKPGAKLVFLESPSNPMLDIVDIKLVSELAHEAGATVIVDNVMASPLSQRPLELGADLVMYSLTKHVDGQGRVLGGAVIGSSEFMRGTLRPFARHTGPALSPFNAWVLLKSLETLPMRVSQMCSSAHQIAEKLEGQGVATRYPFLDSHPQSELARKQMTQGGSTICLDLGSKSAAFDFLNRLELIDISNNLGDARSLATHPASTTHHRLGEEIRERMGITAGVVRISIGLEHPEDLITDLELAF